MCALKAAARTPAWYRGKAARLGGRHLDQLAAAHLVDVAHVVDEDVAGHHGMVAKALTLDTKNKRFVLHVEKDRLKDAPGFDKDKWPNMADQSWAKEIHSYYGTTPYVGGPPA